MTTYKYWLCLLPMTLFGLPLLQQAGFFLGALTMSLIMYWMGMIGVVAGGMILMLCLSCVAAYKYGRWIGPLEGMSPLSYCGPFMLPMILLSGAWIVMRTVSDGHMEDWFLFIYAPFFPVAMLGGRTLMPFVVLLSCVVSFHAFHAGVKKSSRFDAPSPGGVRYVYGLVGALALVCAVQTGCSQREILSGERTGRRGESTEMIQRYSAFAEESPLPRPSAPPSLQITDHYPRLDGATAFFPIYAAAARAIYVDPETGPGRQKRNAALAYSGTEYAYRHLIAGEADLVFAFAPSREQEERAAAKGLTLTLVPIAREAFVFLVNEQNPLKSLELRQIRAIYSGRIDDWREVGGAAGKILPFQRPSDSGSQTIMLKVMGETPLRRPLREEVIAGMGRLMYAVARYRNLPAALGYSFRFYATDMNPLPGVRLLAIDGVEPTAENIRNGRYPLTFDVYMVSARPLSENTQKLRDWFLSSEGQRLIADAGYVPLAHRATEIGTGETLSPDGPP
jgi:phosphate transport system substrate-binding protein